PRLRKGGISSSHLPNPRHQGKFQTVAAFAMPRNRRLDRVQRNPASLNSDAEPSKPNPSLPKTARRVPNPLLAIKRDLLSFRGSFEDSPAECISILGAQSTRPVMP